MANTIETLKNIADGKPVRVFLPLKNGPERYRIQGVYQESSVPAFTLLFKPGVLPIEDIDTDRPAIVNIDIGGSTLSLEALTEEIANPQTLHMIVKKSISHEQMREFFRVDATTDIISRSFHTEVFKNKNEPWSIEGKTVDISGSGILALFPEQTPADRQILLQLTLPTVEKETISLLAHQVRAQKIKDGLFEVAYHFDDITTEDRDKIIGCCLAIQRQLLRLKVQIRR